MKKKYSRILGVALTLVLLASFFGFAAPVSAGTVGWSPIVLPRAGLPFGMNLAETDVGPIAVTPDGGTLFAAVHCAKEIAGVSMVGMGLPWALLQSTDGGHNWTATGLRMNAGPITGIAISSNFATDGTMYVASGITVLRSTNSGMSFIALKPILDTGGSPVTAINSIDMYPASPYPFVMIGVATGGTSNNGEVLVLKDAVFEDWRDQELNLGTAVVAVAFAPDFATSNFIWAVTDTGVVSSTNSPGAWGTILADTNPTAATTVPNIGAVDSACIGFPDDYSSATAPYLWVGLDGATADPAYGGVWRVRGLPAPGPSHLKHQPFPVAPRDVRSIAVSGPMASATILAGQEHAAVISGSLNGGVMWALPVFKQPTGGGVTYVVMAPDFATSNLAYVGTSGLDRNSFQTGPTGGVADWSTAQANTGKYSAYLSDGGVGYTSSTAFGAGRVVISGVNTPLTSITPANLSFWFNYFDDASTGYPYAHPYMILEIDTDVLGALDGVADGWIVLYTSDASYQPTQNTWLQWTTSSLDKWLGAGSCSVGNIGVAVGSSLATFQADDDINDATEAVVLAVKVAVGEWHNGTYIPITAYVDDITIGTTTYALERDSSAFQVSGNGGMSWNQTGLIDTTIGSINDMAVVSLDTIFMVTCTSDLWKTTDATAAAPIWERILTSATATYPPHTLTNITFVETSPEFATDSVVYAAESGSGRGIVKSTDGGNIFAPMGAPAAPITALNVVNATFAFTGAAGQVYRTDDGGYSWLAAMAPVGATNIVSIVTSPDYATDGTILVGNNAGGVYMSTSRGMVFAIVGATTGVTNTYVAFDPGYATNKCIYAGGAGVTTGAEGIFRFFVGISPAWAELGTDLADVSGLMVSPDGTLYAADFTANGGVQRSLNPTQTTPLPPPTFEAMDEQLIVVAPSATLSGLWLVVDPTLNVVGSKNVLFSINTGGTLAPQILTYTDTLATSVVLTAPETGTTFPRITDVTLEWETLTGARMYQWQIARDARFILIADDGFSGYPTDSSDQLRAGQTYYWRVRVAMDIGTTTTPIIVGAPLFSRWSESRTFTTELAGRVWHPFLTPTMDFGGVAPVPGAQDVLTKPTFQWNGADWATSYQLMLADNAAFTGATTKTLTTTSWVCDTDLGYSTTWYWKVIALSATSESEWSDVGVFTTMAEPVAPIVIQDVPDIIVEQPDIVIPAAVEVTPVAPGYLLAIIIVGGVLVIGVIVLIMRTRRPI